MSATNGALAEAPAYSKHVLGVLVENHHGVLARVAGLFAARGFNIDSLTVSTTEEPTMSRMTVTLAGDSTVIDQIRKQLHKLAEVITVEDLTEQGPHIERELILVKVTFPPEKRTDLLEIAAIFKAKSVDMTPETITFEISGVQEKLNNFLTMITINGRIVEIARSGVVALVRGPVGLRQSFLED